MDVLILIGRILFVILFISSGLGHLAKREQMIGYGKAMGMPAPELLVPLTGIQIILGSLMVLLGIWADLGALLLFVFLIPTAFIMHAYWKVDDPEMKQAQMINFQKNIALAGAALMLFALFQQYGGDVGIMITGPLF